MRGCIKGTACGLNPGRYGPAHSTRANKCIPRAQPKGYICLPECVDFGNVDLGKEAEVTPTLPPSAVEIPFMQGSSDGKTTCLARIDRKPYEYHYTIAMR